MPTRYRLRFSSQQIPGDSAPPVTSRHAERLDRSPLHDVRQHARVDSRLSTDHMPRAREFRIFTNESLKLAAALTAKILDRNRLRSQTVWWSQTGSNRRPPACKAGALPTELWPRIDWLASCSSRQLAPPAFATARQPSLRCASEGWWAWEDLNFRPHAYQARALTN